MIAAGEGQKRWLHTYITIYKSRHAKQMYYIRQQQLG